MNTAYPAVPVRFDDRLARLIGIPIVGFLVPLLFFGNTLDDGLMVYVPIWLISTLQTLVYWEGNRFIFMQTRRRFPLVTQTRPRIALLVGLSLTYTLLMCRLLRYGVNLFFPTRQTERVTITEEYVGCFVPLIVCLALYESIYYFRQLQAALLESEKLKKENLQSQLETLKNQVNPHFLFNSLNTPWPPLFPTMPS